MRASDIEHVPMFRTMPRHHLTQALEHFLTPFEVGAGEVLTVQGEHDASLMIVIKGHLDVLVGEPPTVVATVGPGEMLGDMALFGRTHERHATTRTREPTSLLVIDKAGLAALREQGNALVPMLEAQALRTLGKRLREMNDRITEFAQGTEFHHEEPEGLFERIRGWLVPPDPNPTLPAPDALAVLQNSEAFSVLSPELLQALAEQLPVEAVPQGSLLLQEGRQGGDAFIVASGRIDIYRATRGTQNERVAELGPGRLFGTVSLVHGAVRSASCYAAKPTWVLRLPRKVYQAIEQHEGQVASAFRGVIYNALAQQLDSANTHVAVLIRALAESPSITEKERAAYRALVLHTA